MKRGSGLSQVGRISESGTTTRRRTCVGCRRTASPEELVRIAAGADGVVAVGPGPGRGAWLCADAPACFDRAVQRRALSRALRRAVRGDELGQLRATLYERRPAEGRPR